jgi:hypothetical protein
MFPLKEDWISLIVSALDPVLHGPAMSSLADKVGQSFGKSLLQVGHVHRRKRLRQICLKGLSKTKVEAAYLI